MGRVERRRYRRMADQARTARLLLVLTAAVVAVGLAGRLRTGEMQVARVPQPTATPVAAAFDETAVTREVVLPQETWYAIQTGVYMAEDAALTRAAAFSDRGAPGVVVAQDGKYRVLIAAFGSREDAVSVRQRLEERQSVETCLYEWSTPSVTLRLSGMAGQVDVAEAGLSLILTAACQLRDAAAALDQGSLTVDEATDMLAAIDAQAETWQQAVRQRFDRPYPSLLQSEAVQVQAWQTQRDALYAAARQGSTVFSAQLKCAAMTLFDGVSQMRAGISDS